MRTITQKDISKGIKEIRKKYEGKFPLGIVDKPIHVYTPIEIAFSWLDAQRFVDKSTARYDLKEKISDWSGKHISHFHILVAAHVHPDIDGDYPSINLGASSIIPRKQRLENINSSNNLIRQEQAKSRENKQKKQALNQ